MKPIYLDNNSTTKIGNTYFHDKSDRNTYNLTPILDDEEKKAKKAEKKRKAEEKRLQEEML